jgi:hypothetical protein
MKKFLIAMAIMVVLPLLFVGCSQTNLGPVTTRDFGQTDFTNVEVNSSFEVELVQGSSYTVAITAQEKLFDHISVTKNGALLQINVEWGWGTWVSSWGYQRPKVRISMPDLSVLKLSGASKGSAIGFRSTHDTSVSLSGASSLDVDIAAVNTRIEVSGASRLTGKVTSDYLRLQIDGASSANLAGSAGSVDLNESGASHANLEGLTAGSANVELSGASSATVSPKDKMGVKISGASSLTYTGSPSLDSIDVSGASTIHKK